jgi:gamma-glutamylcyclotransferase (GGCT)/AIG2-like uncharacterized protein YtfP
VKLYFAYGSNMNKQQMKSRCPNARPIGAMKLDDYVLVFRGVADIVPSPGDKVSGAVWRLTDACEAALDRYEGFRPNDPADGMYRKETIALEPFNAGGEIHTELMFYVMNSTGIMPPSHSYFAGIRDGYKDFGLSTRPLLAALKASHNDKAPSHIERQRRRRTNHPPLAQSPQKARG